MANIQEFKKSNSDFKSSFKYFIKNKLNTNHQTNVESEKICLLILSNKNNLYINLISEIKSYISNILNGINNKSINYIDIVDKLNDCMVLSSPESVFNELKFEVDTYSNKANEYIINKINNLDVSNNEDFIINIKNINAYIEDVYKNFNNIRKLLISLENKEYLSESIVYNNKYNLFKYFIDVISTNLNESIYNKLNLAIIKIINLCRIENFENLLNNLNRKKQTNKMDIDDNEEYSRSTYLNFNLYNNALAFVNFNHLINTYELYSLKNILIETSSFYKYRIINMYDKFDKIEDYFELTKNIYLFEEQLLKIKNAFNDVQYNQLVSVLDDCLIVNLKEKLILTAFNLPDIYNNIEKIEKINTSPFIKNAYIDDNNYNNKEEFSKFINLIIIENNHIINFSLLSNIEWNNLLNYFKKIKDYSSFKKNVVLYLKNLIEVASKSSKLFCLYLILIKTYFDNLCVNALENDESLKSCIKENFINFINNKPNYLAECFNIFIDMLLSNKEIKKLDVNYNLIFEKFINIFKFIESKDYFIQIYCNKLTYRLMFKTLSHTKIESLLINKLKHLCGIGYVSKAEEIVNDIEQSIELSEKFSSNIQKLNFGNISIRNKSNIHNNAINEYKKTNIEFKFVVINELNYYKKVNLNEISKFSINNKLDLCLDEFISLYKSKFNVRTINYLLEYSESEILLLYNTININLRVTGIQAYILCNITTNKNSEFFFGNIDINKIKKNLYKKFDKNIIDCNIQNLIDSKLIIKNNTLSNNYYKINNINDYRNNEFYNSDSNMLIINKIISSKDGVNDELNIDNTKHLESRKPVIDCLIMKCLKLNKIMSYEKLISSVISASKFECNNDIIESRIENLLKNEYIHKDEDNNLKYFF